MQHLKHSKAGKWCNLQHLKHSKTSKRCNLQRLRCSKASKGCNILVTVVAVTLGASWAIHAPNKAASCHHHVCRKGKLCGSFCLRMGGGLRPPQPPAVLKPSMLPVKNIMMSSPRLQWDGHDRGHLTAFRLSLFKLFAFSRVIKEALASTSVLTLQSTILLIDSWICVHSTMLVLSGQLAEATQVYLACVEDVVVEHFEKWYLWIRGIIRGLWHAMLMHCVSNPRLTSESSTLNAKPQALNLKS